MKQLTNHFEAELFPPLVYFKASACNCPGMSSERSWLDVIVSLRASKRPSGMALLFLIALQKRFDDIVFTSVKQAINDSTWLRCPLHSARAPVT